MTIRLDLDHSALHQVGMNVAMELVGRVVRQTLNRSAALCPVDNGPLRASGSMSPATPSGSEVVGAVEYTADYALAVHNGRRAITIVPRNGKFLRFEVGGRVVYARSVHQPARAGRPFLTDALEEVAGAEGFDVTISIG